ncbi:MAG: PDZ domain-containing protein [Gemmatimonadota bacterium]
MAVDYELSLAEPHTHLFSVRVRLHGGTGTVDLVLPSWTPGSYLMREFPRNVQDFEAHDSAGLPLGWRKLDKNTWRIEGGSSSSITASYRVYANELSVRTSHLDDSHGYVNGASVFVFARGMEGEEARVRVAPPAGWRVATSLHERADGTFVAFSYDELVDSPIEIGNHRTIVWEQEGLPHRYAVWGPGEVDETRLVADTRRVVEVCSRMFGGLPYDRYLFILHVAPDGRGGLEHRASSSLLVSLSWLAGDDYEKLIALVAHEFFHVWLGKRIRPTPLGPFDYTRENYTRNLWVVEGFTTYYTDLILRRAGLMSEARYLERLGEAIARLQALPGRHHQTLEESSFDAWIKFYRPDANTPNAQISYYQKGALVALALDLEIRRNSAGERSLDDVMRLLWERYGAEDVGFPEAGAGGVQSVAEEVYGGSLEALFEGYVRGVAEIDFDAHLEAAGLELLASDDADTPTGAAKTATPTALETRLGLRVRESGGSLTVTHVLAGTPGYEAGVNAGDSMVAVDGGRATLAELGGRGRDGDAGDLVRLTLMRRGLLREVAVRMGPRPERRAKIGRVEAPSEQQETVRKGWLGAVARQVDVIGDGG